MKNNHNKSHNFFLFSGLLVLVVISFSGCNSNTNEASTDQLVAEMNRHVETITLAEAEDDVIPRFNQSKTIACIKAEFRVHGDIPGDLQQGIFSKPAVYPAMLRFANATNMDDSKKDIRGLSIKIRNVDGSILWGEPGVQDFLLNSYPALFVATPEDFLSFIRARQDDKKFRFFLSPFDPHLKSLWIVINARKKHLSSLDIRYWSTVPFRLGESDGHVVKYSVIPCSSYTTTKAVNAGKNQLRAAMKSHLRKEPVCFHFAVQKQTDSVTMPIEDASVIWSERDSPFQTVATITIRNQDFDNPQSLATCEQSSFNPWQSLTTHKPLGRMNEVRRLVYENAAKLRNRE
ncbi:MAG: hypothetical protein JKY62_05815 [Desulfocapsa sp.]|nr:hypothetical protein [Desulfocapsa sp.]